MFAEITTNITDTIAKATVRVTRSRFGKFVSYQCSHKELEMVEMAVENIMGRTDNALQPRSSCPKFILGEWHSDVSFYADASDVPAPYIPIMRTV